ncbi:MAG: hypothetical protein ACI87E_001178 [Mariniblastus sp.]|jgi:hypothetical protein
MVAKVADGLESPSLEELKEELLALSIPLNS